MVVKLTPKGDWLFSGIVAKDAVYKTVGERETPVCEFSVNCGKKENGDTIFINCKAWRNLAGVFSELIKGDSFAGIGIEKKREYAGRTYTDIELEWGNSPMLCGGASEEEKVFSQQMPAAPATSAPAMADADYPDFLQDDGEPCF